MAPDAEHSPPPQHPSTWSIVQRLIHYSNKRLERLWSITAQETPVHAMNKPSGLWVSAEGADDWKEWCKDNSFRSETLRIENVISVKPEANILWLGSVPQLHEFTKRYGVTSYLNALHPGLFTEPCIDWPRVALDYQGIIITPYQWSCRLERFTSWYYGWDCASGCIWDVEAIDVERSFDGDADQGRRSRNDGDAVRPRQAGSGGAQV